jgi:hypothetical protein
LATADVLDKIRHSRIIQDLPSVCRTAGIQAKFLHESITRSLACTFALGPIDGSLPKVIDKHSGYSAQADIPSTWTALSFTSRAS